MVYQHSLGNEELLWLQTRNKELRREIQLAKPSKEIGEDWDLMDLEYFTKEILPTYASFSAEVSNRVVRRVARTEGLNRWIVEVLNEEKTSYNKPDLSQTRSTVEWRDFYLVNDDVWQKLTEDSVTCYVEKTKVVKHIGNLPNGSPLKKDMLLLFGECSGEEYFVSLYENDTGKKIDFTDPRGLRSKISPRSRFYPWVITPEGNTLGYSTLDTYGKEPVIVVHFVPSYGNLRDNVSMKGSYGQAIFSVRTGQLLDLINYGSF